jgi:hypothetical protein
MQGIEIGTASGGQAGGDQPTQERPTRPRGPRPQPRPIEVQEPPTYVRIVWDEDAEIDFYPGQRRYIRIETDANSSYYNPDNPETSKINIVVQGSATLKGSTPLRGGRMRVILDVPEGAPVSATGTLRVELSRSGRPALSDERGIVVREAPPARPGRTQLTLPPFEPRPVSPDDEKWVELGWPDDVTTIASSAEMENGTLVIYYSTAYPKYAGPLARYEQRDQARALSFTKRYEVWLATHSLLYHRDHEQAVQIAALEEGEGDVAEERERQERCRMATLAALFAAREVELAATSASDTDTQDA